MFLINKVIGLKEVHCVLCGLKCTYLTKIK